MRRQGEEMELKRSPDNAKKTNSHVEVNLVTQMGIKTSNPIVQLFVLFFFIVFKSVMFFP